MCITEYGCRKRSYENILVYLLYVHSIYCSTINHCSTIITDSAVITILR